MAINKDGEMKNKYEIKKYERDFPLSTHIEQLRDYLDYKAEEEVHLRDYINVILKRKKVVMIFLVSVFVTTLILSFMMTPLYKATAVIKIMGDNPNVLSFTDVQGLKTGPDYYQTQYEILKSRSLAEEVIRKLNLHKNKDFMPVKSKIDKIKDAIFDNTIGIIVKIYRAVAPKPPVNKKTVNYDNLFNSSLEKEEIPDNVVNALISRLEVTPVKNSQLVKVSFISHNPEISMNVANAVAQTYIAFDLESRVDTSKEARAFLQNQVEIMKKKVEESEQKLNEYAASKEIIMDKDRESIQTQKLVDISSALNSITTERMQKEALYREVKESGGNNPVILSNPLIQGLKSQLSSLEAEYSSLSKTFTPDYPKMKSLKSQIDSIHERIEQEKSKIIEALKSDYEASLKKEENLTKALNAQKRKVLSYQDTIAQFEVLKREVDSNKALYNTLLQRLNEVGVAASSTATNIQILDKAVFPRWPFKPNIVVNMLLSIIFGFVGGIGLAFLAEYFDNSVKDTKDIEKEAKLPTLGMIPNFQDIEKGLNIATSKVLSFEEKLSSPNTPVLVDSEKTTPIAEAFRSIAAFIMLSSASRPPKTILVTGAGEKVGKTTVSINIAKALVESLGNGLIIDGDLRRPKLHHSLRVNNSVGLSTFLSGNMEFDGSNTNGGFIKPTYIRGLSIITSGPIPPNPSELLGSSRMDDLISVLESSFEFIIIDSPPAIGLPDALYLSKIVDGTVLVAKAGETPKKALLEIKEIFRNVNAKIFGVILNSVRKSDLKYGSYNYYHSSYYSSYFEEEKD
ncbi:MAG: GumC family protein [Thermodesulfovibrionales bacterium]